MRTITAKDLLNSRENELIDSTANLELIDEILTQVKAKGDQALKRYSELFDNTSLDRIKLSQNEIESQAMKVSDSDKRAIDIAYENIWKYHALQKPKDYKIETSIGIKCEMRYLPIESVGFYIPGGSAVLFSSLLMTAIPSLIAGNKYSIVCTPPTKEGTISPHLAYTAIKCATRNIYLVGGAQAVAAMAYGTESVPKVDKIFGPGNSFVTLAKQVVANRTRVAIDMPAGPSEVLIIADPSANEEILAADLLSQLEHGEDSRAVLITTDNAQIEKTKSALFAQKEKLSRKSVLDKSIDNCAFILVNSVDKAIEISNDYAPEHLILSTESYQKDRLKITRAGSVFLSKYAAESFGDYASGTNHTLPTMGLASAYSGITVNDFYLSQMIQEITKDGLLDLGPIVKQLADAEKLDAHASAITKRLELYGVRND